MQHCLEKSPEERFQSARDIAFALQALGVLPTTLHEKMKRLGLLRRADPEMAAMALAG